MRRFIASLFAILLISAGVLYSQVGNTGRQYTATSPIVVSGNNISCPTCGTSSGTVTTSGSPANGNLTKFSGATSITNADLTGAVTTAGGVATTLATRYATVTCQPGLGDGLNAIPSGTYLMSECLNDFGATFTITSIKCFTDNNGTSTLNATNSAATALLTGAITCTNAFAAGTQSGTTTLAAADFVKWTFVADGTSKQVTFVITGTL